MSVKASKAQQPTWGTRDYSRTEQVKKKSEKKIDNNKESNHFYCFRTLNIFTDACYVGFLKIYHDQ